jgi:predicted dehydrogenase
MSASKQPVRIGVIGYRFGQYHVRTLVNMPEARLVAVADLDSQALEAGAQKYGFTPYRDAVEMMDREQLDAISICTSPKWRRPLMGAAIARSLAMFVEKPWAANSAEARELADICRRSRAPVMAGFSFRFHPAIVKLHELLDGELGQPRMLNGQYVFGWLPPADHWLWDPTNGNGFINENSCHLLDTVCHLLGRPVRVTAEGGRFAQRPMEDSAAVVIRFDSGAIAALTCGGIGAPAFDDYPQIDLQTASGQACLRGRHHVWDSLSWATAKDAAVRHLAANPEQLGATRYTHAFGHFFRCIREGAAPSATIDDGVMIVDLAMAIAESARSGGTVTLSGELPS